MGLGHVEHSAAEQKPKLYRFQIDLKSRSSVIPCSTTFHIIFDVIWSNILYIKTDTRATRLASPPPTPNSRWESPWIAMQNSEVEILHSCAWEWINLTEDHINITCSLINFEIGKGMITSPSFYCFSSPTHSASALNESGIILVGQRIYKQMRMVEQNTRTPPIIKHIWPFRSPQLHRRISLPYHSLPQNTYLIFEDADGCCPSPFERPCCRPGFVWPSQC